MAPNPLRVVFMGTPQFAVPCLQALMAHPDVANVVAVYTQPDKPSGRGQKMGEPPIKVEALKYGLPVFQPENINKNEEPRKLATLMADIVVVVAYAQFLGKAVLNTPRLGCINVHSSLLPKYRGAAPIQFAIWKGESETGVTTMKLVSKMDAGPILLRDSMPISATLTAGELHDQLSDMGAALLIKTLQGLQTNSIQETQQDESQVTYATLISKDMGRIDWTKTGREIDCQIRAFTPWPGTFSNSTRGMLKIHKAVFQNHIPGLSENLKTGDVCIHGAALFVKCADGWIELKTIQLEGKKPVSASDFLNGIKQGPEFRFLSPTEQTST